MYNPIKKEYQKNNWKYKRRIHKRSHRDLHHGSYRSFRTNTGETIEDLFRIDSADKETRS